jgi:drug/metabolite transporter (DMT)-like permease
VLMSVGLLYVSASIYQMLRGAEMLFSAGFSVLFLKRRLHVLHVYGILGCMVSLSVCINE